MLVRGEAGMLIGGRGVGRGEERGVGGGRGGVITAFLSAVQPCAGWRYGAGCSSPSSTTASRAGYIVRPCQEEVAALSRQYMCCHWNHKQGFADRGAAGEIKKVATGSRGQAR